MSDWYVPEWATSLGTHPGHVWRDGVFSCAALWDIIERRWPGVALDDLLRDVREDGAVYPLCDSPTVKFAVRVSSVAQISGLADGTRRLRDGCSLSIWVPGALWGDRSPYHIYVDEPTNALVFEQDLDVELTVLGPDFENGFSLQLPLDVVLHDVYAQLVTQLVAAAHHPDVRGQLPPRVLTMAELGPWLRENTPLPFVIPPEAEQQLEVRAPYLIANLRQLAQGMGWKKIVKVDNYRGTWGALRAEMLVELGFVDRRVHALRKLGVPIREHLEADVVAYLDTVSSARDVAAP